MIGAMTILPVGAAIAADAGSGTPESVVGSVDDALLQAMKGGAKLGYQGRFDLLAPVLATAFDFHGMTRMAVGSAWTGLAPAQQEALVQAFTRFSIANYARQFDSYSGEQFRITGRSEPPQGVVVQTVMALTEGDPVKFNYLLHQVEGAWRIIDIYLDGTISQLAVRRSEFAAVLGKSGPGGLLQLLDEKTQAMARG